jgi:hypothetical protein
VIRKAAIYGHYLSAVSLMNFMIGQMARFQDAPWRFSNLSGGAKTFDAQAGYESATPNTPPDHLRFNKTRSPLSGSGLPAKHERV